MSGIMSKIFGQPQQPAAPAQPATPAPGAANPANLATQSNTATADNGMVPAGSDKSPLDVFADLWKPVEVKEGQVAKPALGDPYITFDQNKIHEAARKIDFTQGIPADIISKAAAGGEDGVRALLDAVNQVARTVQAQGSLTSANIAESSLQKAGSRFSSLVPDLVRSNCISDAIRTDNPIFSNPAAAPMLKMFEQQLITKYPDATSAQITELAKNYMTSFAESINPKQPAPDNKGQITGDNVDWESFFQ